jgi:xanthine dehydrogenase YagT iron-sulfur-binding subunit
MSSTHKRACFDSGIEESSGGTAVVSEPAGQGRAGAPCGANGADDSGEETSILQRFGLNAEVSRRRFLQGSSALAAAVALDAPTMAQGIVAPNSKPVTLRINGKSQTLTLDPRTSLLDALRETLDLTGTKKGCDHGQCGACTVHINGRRVLSCMSFAVMHQGDEITTIEGLGQPGNLHPMQAAFVEHDAYQCGYCTSGQIMSAVALLKEPVGPTDEDVKTNMYGNICRCGTYPNIVAAVQAVRSRA